MVHRLLEGCVWLEFAADFIVLCRAG